MRPSRWLVGAAASAALVLAGASAAWAHVEIEPGSLPQGGEGTIMFRVPNEADAASTVKLEVQLPADRPIGEVLLSAPAGWTVTLDKASGRVTWTGGKIDPGRFERFALLVAGLPTGVDSIAFPTLQTYSNGDVVRWIDVQAPGAPEPDHPVPVLKLTAAEGGGGTTTTVAPPTTTTAPVATTSVPVTTAAPATTTPPTPTAPATTIQVTTTAATTATTVPSGDFASKSTGTTALLFGILGVLLGVTGVALGAVALSRLRARQSSRTATSPATGEFDPAPPVPPVEDQLP